MNPDPTIECIQQGRFQPVWYDNRVIPSGTAINQMKDDVVMHKHHVSFHDSIKCVGEVEAGHVFGLRLGPIPTWPARVHNRFDEIKNVTWDAGTPKQILHRFGRSMPPPNVEFSQCKPGLACTC